MLSSSQLFPVSLMRADFAGPLAEDVYQLNPGISPDISVRVAVTRVTDPAWEGPRRPVILLHSEFHNRRQWLSPEGRGFAARLAGEGFDVWLPEMRGHGLSPVNTHWSSNTLSSMALEDWPALHAFVTEQSGLAPVWLGVGVGGLSLSYSFIQVPEIGDAAGLVLVDCPTGHWFPGLSELSLKQRWLARRRGYVDGPALNWGMEREPWALFAELREWHRRRKGGQHPIMDHLRAVKVRSLVVAAHEDGTRARALQGRLGGLSRELRVFRSPGSRQPAGPFTGDEVEVAILEWLGSSGCAKGCSGSSSMLNSSMAL